MFDKFFKRSAASAPNGADSAMNTTHTQSRWVVLDTETTGLSLWRDRLISIAAVAIHVEPELRSARIRMADSFEAVIKPPEVTRAKLTRPNDKRSKENILIHHIGVHAQTVGEDQAAALERFKTWIGSAPLFAFHAPFDQSMVNKAYKKVSLTIPQNPWIDVALLANWVARDALHLSLDDRMKQFGLQCMSRHQAAGDTLVTAEMLLKMLPALRRKVSDVKGLADLARDQIA